MLDGKKVVAEIEKVWPEVATREDIEVKEIVALRVSFGKRFIILEGQLGNRQKKTTFNLKNFARAKDPIEEGFQEKLAEAANITVALCELEIAAAELKSLKVDLSCPECGSRLSRGSKFYSGPFVNYRCVAGKCEGHAAKFHTAVILRLKALPYCTLYSKAEIDKEISGGQMAFNFDDNSGVQI